MTDLTLPPLTLVPQDPPGQASPAAGEDPGLAWPPPPVGRFRAPVMPACGLPCELEGLNGRVMHVVLTRVDLAQGGVEVISPGLRAPLQLRFAQFRRLSLPTLLEPDVPPAAGQIQSYRLRPRSGTDRNGLTAGYVETPGGVFLYEPQDNRGAVRRVFVPSTAFESLTIGSRLLQGASARPNAAAATPAPAAGDTATPPSGTGRAAPAATTPAASAAAAPPAPRPTAPAPLEAAQPAGKPSLPPSAMRPAAQPGPGEPIPFPTLADVSLDLTPPWAVSRKPAAAEQKPATPPRPTAVAAGTRAERSAGNTAPLTLELKPLAADEPPTAGLPPKPEAPADAARATGTSGARAQATPPRTADNAVADEVLRGKPVVSADELLLGVERQAKMPMLRMGEALVALGHITSAQLDLALAAQKGDRSVPLGEILVRSGALGRHQLQQAMVRKMGYPVVDLEAFTPDTEALAKVSYAVASRLEVLPLLLRGGRLYVATEDPTRSKAIDELEFASGCKVVPALAPPGRLAAAIDARYQQMGAETAGARLGGSPQDGETLDAAELLASLESEGPDRTVSEEDRGIEQSDNSLVRLINQMILEAQGMGVSDIHIESQPGREKVRIRFRRDGVLRPYIELPHTYRNALIARIKIMCDLDISEKRKPQDGKIAFGKFHPGSKLELRVATIPTANGLEDAVLRLLASARPLPLDDIGLSARNLPLVKSMVERPYGMFLCVGPTGSGKTTTLHSALGYINQPDRKIWTAEDPIEITQPGLRQVQVNPKIELTFARALRAFLRADPDVIMVGEIRDKETAAVAVESSLTGHLVLSTLHTNSAPETVTRLLDMGMDPFNFADALLGVLAQRLVRRICGNCRSSREATPAEIEEMLADYLNAFGAAESRPREDDVLASWRERFGLDGKLMHYHGAGCDKCGGSGLRGRAGIHELMPVSRDIRRLIQTGARAEQLQKTAMADGMLTLRQDGIEKVLQGVTTLAEVRSSSN